MTFLHNLNFRQLLLVFSIFTVGFFLLNSAIAAYLMERINHETILRRTELQRLIAMKDLESDLGFTSREMAHQVLADTPQMAAEQTPHLHEKTEALQTHLAHMNQTTSTSTEQKNS